MGTRGALVGMSESSNLNELVLRAKALRDRAGHARRLALQIFDRLASEGLTARAAELDEEAEGLEAQIAVLKQSMAETNPENQDMAALKPPQPESDS
jgi:hypothetical protein